MKRRRKDRQQYLAELYSEGVLEGIKIGAGGVTEMLDGLIEYGIERMDLVTVRSMVEQMRMRAALGIDTKAVAALGIDRAGADDE